MAAWDEELGNLLPSPGAVGSTAPSWSAWVQDPVNRAGLLSFGTQLMTGGGGTFGQELGGALAKGYEGAAGTEALIEKRREQAEEEAFKERELAQRAALQGQQRSTQLEVAKIGAASRAELERMRAEGRREGLELRGQQAMERLERKAELGGGGAGTTGKGLHTKNTAFSQTMKEFSNRFPYASLDSLTDEQSEWIENRRNQLFMEGRGGTAPQGAAPAGGAPAAAATPAPGAAPAAARPAGAITLQVLKNNPTIAPYLNTPEGRDQIRKTSPQAAAAIDELERELQGADYRAR